jgi:phosphinothricin acetyltransferase
VIHCGREHLEAIRGIYNHEIVHTTALYEYEPRSVETIVAWWAAKQAAGLPVLGIEAEPGVLAGFASWGPFRPFPAYGHTVEHSVYVDERFRGRGVGRTLLAALARECVEKNYSRLSWSVLEWNTDAIALYDAVGGHPLTEWIGYRVSGPELSALARSAGDVIH